MNLSPSLFSFFLNHLATPASSSFPTRTCADTTFSVASPPLLDAVLPLLSQGRRSRILSNFLRLPRQDSLLSSADRFYVLLAPVRGDGPHQAAPGFLTSRRPSLTPVFFLTFPSLKPLLGFARVPRLEESGLPM